MVINNLTLQNRCEELKGKILKLYLKNEIDGEVPFFLKNIEMYLDEVSKLKTKRERKKLTRLHKIDRKLHDYEEIYIIMNNKKNEMIKIKKNFPEFVEKHELEKLWNLAAKEFDIKVFNNSKDIFRKGGKLIELKKEIIKIKGYYPEFVEKHELEKLLLETSIILDNELFDKIKQKIEEEKQICKLYEKLKSDLKTVKAMCEKYNRDFDGVKFKQRIEKGKKEADIQILLDVQYVFDDIHDTTMASPEISVDKNPFRHGSEAGKYYTDSSD